MPPDWGYALAQGIAGAAASGVASLDEAQKQRDADAAANRELDVKTRLQASEAMLKQQAEDAKRNRALATGQAISTGATGLLNSTVAGNINAKFGSNIDPNDPDSAASLTAIRANPAATAAYGLMPESDLAKAQARAEAARNMGDTTAAAEEDKNVRNLTQDKANEAKDSREQRRLDQQQEWQQGQLERQTLLAQKTLEYQQRMLSASDTRAQEQIAREQRAATAKALDGVAAQMKDLETESKDMTITPERKTDIQRGLASLRNEAAIYRRTLAGAGIEGDSSVPSGGRPPLSTFDKGAGAPAAPATPATPAPASQGGLLATARPAASPVAPMEENPAGLENTDLAQIPEKRLWELSNRSGDIGDRAVEELKRRGLIARTAAADQAVPANTRMYFDQSQ